MSKDPKINPDAFANSMRVLNKAAEAAAAPFIAGKVPVVDLPKIPPSALNPVYTSVMASAEAAREHEARRVAREQAMVDALQALNNQGKRQARTSTVLTLLILAVAIATLVGSVLR